MWRGHFGGAHFGRHTRARSGRLLSDCSLAFGPEKHDHKGIQFILQIPGIWCGQPPPCKLARLRRHVSTETLSTPGAFHLPQSQGDRRWVCTSSPEAAGQREPLPFLCEPWARNSCLPHNHHHHAHAHVHAHAFTPHSKEKNTHFFVSLLKTINSST